MENRYNGSSEDPQDSETTSLCSEQTDHSTPSTYTQEKSEKSSEKLQCNVQCYGRGGVHEKIVKELNIKQYEGPRIPCVLFVYNVSGEIEDFQDALQWVTGGGRVRKEDICAVILLQKSRDVGEGKIRTYPELFHEGTAVHRVPWSETTDILRRKKAVCRCPNTIQAIRQSLSDRTRSREHSSSGSSDDPQDSETPSLCSEQTDHSTPSTYTQEKSEKSSEKLQCNGSSEDPQDSETPSSCSEQTDHSTPSTYTQEKSEKSSEKLQCNVQCYGRGGVHEKIVKELNIKKYEGPRIPCVLFVYKVSGEIEDFQDALQWVTGGGRVRKEDICAVILLQKSRDVGEGKIRTYPGLFHEGTAVHRVPWSETTDILRRKKAVCRCPNTIQAIRQSLSDRTRSREHSSSGSSDDPQDSETPSLCSEQTDHSTPSTYTQEKSEKSSEKLHCNGVGRVWKEDICAVILLQKSRDVGEGQIRTYPELFHEGTAVHRVSWSETTDILRRKKAVCRCPNTIQAIRQSLSGRTRSREDSSSV